MNYIFGESHTMWPNRFYRLESPDFSHGEYVNVTAYNNSEEVMQCRNTTIVKLIYHREDSHDSHISFGKGTLENLSYSEIRRHFREADEIINRPEDTVQCLWYEGDLTVSMFFKNGKLHEMILTDIAGILGL